MNKAWIRKGLAVAGTVFAMLFAGFGSPLRAASQYVPQTICHYDATSGTYQQLSLTFANSDEALQVGGHIVDTTTSNASDIWPAFTYSQTTSEVNVPASKNWQVYQLTTVRLYNPRTHTYTTVTRYMWVPNTVTQGIFNNGCVVP